MTEIVLLGTGTPNPDPHRAGSSVAVVDGASWVMVDCGRAATQRALEARLDLRSLEAVLLTHHHSDHVSDLATLAIARWVAGAATSLRVVAPNGPAADFAQQCLETYADQAFHGQADPAAGSRPSIAVEEFRAGTEPATVFDDADWTAVSVLVDHHPVEPAVGYRVERGGVRVAISGDTAVCGGIRQLADGARALVHEALLTARVSASSLEWNASAESVGTLAASTRPDVLVLTHLFPAPRNDGDAALFVNEVRAGGFTGRVVVAHDLMRLPVSDGTPGAE